MALQRCAVHSGTPLGMLCRAVQELHRCLTSVIESGDLINLKDVRCGLKDPMAPASKGRAPLLTPRVEPPVSVPTPSKPDCIRARRGCTTRGTHPCAKMKTTGTPWLFSFVDGWVWLTATRAGRLAHEHTPGNPTGFCLLGVPTGDHITFSSDGQSMMWVPFPDHCPDVPDPEASLQLALPKPPDQPDSSPQIEELWANAMLFTWPTSNYTAPRLLGSDQKCVVSSFVSVTNANKHDEASLINEWSDVTQHMNVHLLSH